MMYRTAMFLVALVVLAAAQQAGGTSPDEEPATIPATIETLQRTVDRLNTELAEVKAALAALQTQQQKTSHDQQIAQLRASAAEAKRETAPSDALDTSTTFSSGERMQPQLNPELSVTGDVWAITGGDRGEFQLRGAELDLQSDLDPYSRAHVVLGAHGEGCGPLFGTGAEAHGEAGADVEEAYVTWLHLPGAVTLTVGKKRQQFGVLNRWHEHALDQTDLPWVLTENFGDEGLSGTGVSLDWLLPSLWAHANELTVEVTNGDNETAFGGSDWDRPTAVARLKSYWDLNQDSYLELGLDGAHGASDHEGNLASDFFALDATYNWNPANRSLYRDITVRGMLLRSRRELAPDNVRTAWGGYLYGQGKLSQRWIAGVRFDRVDDPVEADHSYWGVSPYLTFWQSEFVRLRGQLSYRDNDVTGVDRRFVLQATFSAGPHKHESY